MRIIILLKYVLLLLLLVLPAGAIIYLYDLSVTPEPVLINITKENITACGECQYLQNEECINYRCCSERDCEDFNDMTKNICKNRGTKLAECEYIIETNLTAVDYAPETNLTIDEDSLKLSPIPYHEDSTILVTLNSAELEPLENYASLGFIVYKENEQIFFPFGEGQAVGKWVKTLSKNRNYTTTVANLRADSEYEICLNGLFADYTSAGNFNCKKIRTATEKQKHALVLINYDVEVETQTLIDEWINEVQKTGIIIHKQNLNQGTTSQEVYGVLKNKYEEVNLLYAVFIGQDLPMPAITNSGPGSFSYPFQSMTFDTTNQDNGFSNSDTPLREISIAVIKYSNQTKIQNYFRRVITEYKSSTDRIGKLLLADAMIPAESSMSDYNFPNTEYLGGITDYGNQQQAETWQTQYKQRLAGDYDIVVINAHGSRTGHYPYGQTSIDSDFIRQNPPKIPFIISLSCNIGYFMQDNSPMLAYVFEGQSLAGIGSEVFFVDVSNTAAKYLLEKMLGRERIGDASRPFGFTVFGDPFLRLD